jgi:hypothetical protein
MQVHLIVPWSKFDKMPLHNLRTVITKAQAEQGADLSHSIL